MSNSYSKPPLKFGEFVVLMASMMALVAMSIDAMLPALSVIGAELEVEEVNRTQLIISIIFLGMALGQIIYGPLSDTLGRNITIYAGFALFFVGSAICVLTSDFETLLAGRFLQGFGLASPRIVCTAIIRDQYAGNAMARVVSFTMAIFILVPMVAPAFGQLVLLVANWRVISVAIFAIGLITHIWFAIRQPDSLAAEKRIPFSLRGVLRAMIEVVRCRIALSNTLIAGLISGSFLAYLSTVQQIFQIQYGLGKLFPLVFAMLALSIGLSSFINSRLVMKFGMQHLTWKALIILSLSSVIAAPICLLTQGHPPLIVLLVYLAIALFSIGILFGNLNAMAMEPLGHSAGVGAAVIGSLSTFISVPLGITIAQCYEGSIVPIVAGFAVCGLISMVIMVSAKQRGQ